MGFMDANGKAAKFLNIGDEIKGTVTRVEFDIQTKNLKNEDVTEDRIHLTDDEGDERTVYVNKFGLANAIRSAVIAAGLKTLSPGDRIKIVHTALQPAKQPGHNPSKLFEAVVKPGSELAGAEAVASAPAPALSVDDL